MRYFRAQEYKFLNPGIVITDAAPPIKTADKLTKFTRQL